MNKRTLIEGLQTFANKSFCEYTAERATASFYRIKDYIPKKYQMPIYALWQEVGNPDNGVADYHEACMYLKKYIEEVIVNIKNRTLLAIESDSYAVRVKLNNYYKNVPEQFYKNGSLYDTIVA